MSYAVDLGLNMIDIRDIQEGITIIFKRKYIKLHIFEEDEDVVGENKLAEGISIMIRVRMDSLRGI